MDEKSNPRWQLYNAIRTFTDPEGACLAKAFLKLPSKRQYPDYYKEIQNPLSLFQIRKKLCNGRYGTVSEVVLDLNTLFENTKKFNESDSKLYKDAVKLQAVMQVKVQELLDFHRHSSGSDEKLDDSPTAAKPKNPGGQNYSRNNSLQHRLWALYECLIDYVTEDGKQPILMFMESPPKKLHPDYYKVIQEPIDMLTIKNNICSEKYSSEEEILEDFKLMFRNCREYSEESSLIYEDAMTLEHVLTNFVDDGFFEEKQTLAEITDQVASIAVLEAKRLPLPSPKLKMVRMKKLFSTIKDYRDQEGRQLSIAFNKLHSKLNYPNYYGIIKQPINLKIIRQKLEGNCYEGLNELVSDFLLMFDNVFKYNKSNSQVYKDALILQQLTLQTKLHLTRKDEDTDPDVANSDQELLTSLCTVVYNHQDDEGHGFYDSFALFTENGEIEGKKNELYQNGDFMNSSALNSATPFDLTVAVNSSHDIRNSEKFADSLINGIVSEVSVAAKREEEGCISVIPSARKTIGTVNIDTLNDHQVYNQQVYRVFDFVYVELKEKETEWTIYNIQRLWVNRNNQQMMYGNLYYRPSETYHVISRKFMAKEVFKTEQRMALPLSCVKGRCAVLGVKDYPLYRPDGFDDNDIYVCESQYSTRARLFKKIKSWPPFGLINTYELITRKESLERNKTSSACGNRVEKRKKEITELEEQEIFLKKEKLGGRSFDKSSNDTILHQHWPKASVTSNQQAKLIKIQKHPERGEYLGKMTLKPRLYALCKCLMDYVTEDGRQPMLLLMEKPSKKLYPKYYKVIQKPIDMLTILNNVRSERYNNEEEILEDFKLMFRNCREYSEENSLIYKDAISLERELMDIIKNNITEESGSLLEKNLNTEY